MKIRKMIPQDKKKQRIYLEDGTVFALYNGEIYRMKLEEEAELSEERFQEIMTILKKRARERCFFLLKDSDKTEEQIRRKLKEGYYPPSVIEETLSFLKEHRYVDDARYALFFIEQMKERKSRREISAKLMERGVSRDIIDNLLEDTELDEETALGRLMERKLRGKDLKDTKGKEKIYQYFYRKGYSLSAIESAYRAYFEGEEERDNF